VQCRADVFLVRSRRAEGEGCSVAQAVAFSGVVRLGRGCTVGVWWQREEYLRVREVSVLRRMSA